MKDFHTEPITEAMIGPLILFHHPDVNNIFVRIQPTDIQSTVQFLEQEWDKINPATPFKYNFLDEEFDEFFKDIDQTSRAVQYFTVFAIFIASLGLFGLASFSTERRRKEIGIRKVLGSSELKIINLLYSDYLKLVGFAVVFSVPTAYMIMHSWLANFPYHINMHWSIFVLSSFMILGITLITVGFQALRAARSNPVESLRYE
jgi:putative ABC transport system permease protein